MLRAGTAAPPARRRPLPRCGGTAIALNGQDDVQPHRQRYRCAGCSARFDDLSGTVLAGRHRPLRLWVLCLYSAVSVEHEGRRGHGGIACTRRRVGRPSRSGRPRAAPRPRPARPRFLAIYPRCKHFLAMVLSLLVPRRPPIVVHLSPETREGVEVDECVSACPASASTMPISLVPMPRDDGPILWPLFRIFSVRTAQGRGIFL